MTRFSEEHVYDALVLPNEAIASGGIEILRAGIIDDDLYVTARRAFADPAQWGEVFADIARRLAALYEAEGELKDSEAIAAIAAAFAAELGARAVDVAPRKPKAKKTTKAKAKTASTTTSKTKSPARGKAVRAAEPARAKRAKTPSRPAARKRAGQRSKR